MSEQRFEELAAAWGAQRRRWPQDERAIYDAYADTPRGRAILAEAGQVDTFLDGWQPGPDDPARAGRIVAAATFVPARRATFGWLSTALAACALAGFVLGYAATPEDTGEQYVYELLLGNTDYEEFQ